MLPRAVRALALAAAATLLGFAPSLAAQTVPPATGSDLTRSCNALLAYASQGGEITLDATSCAAYLRGLRDAVELATVRSPADRAFCPGGARLDELARVVVKHLQERPDAARKPAAGEAMGALTRAYPCATS